MQFREFAERWIDKAEHGMAATYADKFRYMIKKISREFGKRELSDITWLEVQDWLRGLPLKQISATDTLRYFSMVMKEAEEAGLITVNPLAGKRIKMYRSDRKFEPKPYNGVERALILKNLPTDELRNLFQFLMWTGVRISEMRALQWEQVDFARGLIHITCTLTECSKGRFENTKTGSSHRSIKMLKPARDALLAQRDRTGRWSGFVFSKPSGCRWTSHNLGIKLKETCDKCRLIYRSPYTMRHTYASMMLTAGEKVAWVASQLGHTSPDITTKYYARWISQDDDTGGSMAETQFG